MSLEVGGLIARMGLDAADYFRGLDQVEQKSGSWASQLSAKITAAGASMMGFGSKLTLGITTPLLGAAMGAVSLASNLNESMNKADVVFGTSAAVIQAWSQTSAAAFGATRQEALEAVGTFGNLFTSMGMGVQPAAEMSMGLVQLAGDLSSFNNIPVADALMKLRSGLVGEVEPLRTLGVNLNAADVQARALAMGLAKTKDELTPAMLVQARYALILEQTKNAQGDFARTSDGLANSQRILTAQIKDAAAAMGTALLPIATQIVGKISELVGKFTALSPETQKWILIAGGIAAAIGPAITVIGALVAGVGALISPLGLVVVAVGALALAWSQNWGGIRDKVLPIINTVVTAVKTGFGKLMQTFNAGGLPAVGAQLTTWWDGVVAYVQTNAPTWGTKLQTEIKKAWAYLTTNVFPAIGDALTTWWDGIVTYVQTNAPTWGTKLQTEIKKAWAYLTTNVFPAIGDALTTWWDGIVLYVQTNAPTWGTKLQTEIKKAWAYLTTNVFPAIGDALTTWWDGIVLYVQTNAPAWGTTLQTAMAGVWKSLTTFDTGSTQGQTGFGKFMQGIGQEAAKLKPLLEPLIGILAGLALRFAIGGILTAFATGLTAVGVALNPVTLAAVAGTVAFAALGVYLVEHRDQVAALGKQLQDFFAPMMQRAGEAVGSLGTQFEVLQPKLAALGAAFEPVFKLIATVVGAAVVIVADLLGNTLVAIIDNAGLIIGGLVEIVTGGMDLVSGIIGGMVTVVSELVQGDWAGAWTAAQAFAQQAWDGIVEIVNGALSVLDGLMGTLYDTIVNTINDLLGTSLPKWDEFKAQAVKAFEGLVTGVTTTFGNVKSAVEGGINDVKGFLTGINLEQIGRDIIGGLVTGVRDAIDTLRQAVEDAANALPQWVKDILGIKSPSTVFIQIGKDIIAGMIVGMEFMSPAAAQAAADAVRGVADAAMAEVAMIRALGELEIPANLWENFDALMRVVDKIAWAFRNYAASTGLGGNAGKLVSNFAATVSAVAGALSGLATLAAQVRDVPDMSGLEAAVPRLLNLLVTVGQQLDEVRQTKLPDIGPLFTLFSDALASAAAPLQAAIGLAQALASAPATWPTDRLTGLAEFVGAIALAVQGLQTGLKKVVTAELATFAQQLGTIAESLVKGLTFLEAMRTWKLLPDLAERFDRFATVWGSILELLDGLRKRTAAFATDEMRKFTTAVGEIADGLTKALNLLAALDMVAPAGDFGGALARVMDLLDQALTAFRARLDGWDTAKLALVTAFGAAVGGLMTGLKAALELATAAPTTWPALTEATWQPFFDWVQTAFDSLYTWINRGDAFAGTKIYTKEGLDLVTAWGSALGSIVGGLQAAANFQLAKDWTVPTFGLWAAFTGWVKTVFDLFYTWINRGDAFAGTKIYTKEGLDLVTAWGSALGSVVGGLQAAANFQLAKDWTAPTFDLWAAFVVWVVQAFDLFYVWINRGDAFAGTKIYTKEGLDLVTAWGSALGSVVGGLQAAANFQLAKDWTAPTFDLWAAFVVWVVQAFDLFYVWINRGDAFAGTKIYTQEGFDLVTAWGSALGSVVGGLQAAANFALAQNWTAPDTGLWNRFFTWVTTAFDGFYTWVNRGGPVAGTLVYTQEGFDLVTAWGSALGSVVGGLQAAANFALAQNWTAPDTGLWNRFFTWVTTAFDGFYTWVNRGGPVAGTLVYTQEGFDLVTAWGSALGSVVGGLQAAANFALAQNWTAPDTGLWNRFFTWVTTAFDGFYTWVNRGGPVAGTLVYTQEGFDLVTAWGSALGSVVGGLQAAANFALAQNWTAPDTGLWNRFFTWVTTAFDGFYTWVNRGGPVAGTLVYTQEGFDLVTAWGSALGSVVGGLQAAANFALAQNWTAPDTGLWNRFFTWVTTAFDGFYTWVNRGGPVAGTPVYTQEGFDLVTAWGSALGSVVGGLQAAANFALAQNWTAPDTGLWNRFFTWVTTAFDGFYTWVNRGGPVAGTLVYTQEGFDLVTAWGSALGSVVGGLQAAANFALAQNWTAPDTGLWNRFFTWVTTAFDGFYTWVNRGGPVAGTLVYTQEGFDLVTAWGSALGSVVGGLQAALALAKDFTFTEPNGDTWENFQGWVQGVMARLVAWVTTTYPAGVAFEPVTSFGTAMTAVFGGLGAALDVFKRLQGFIGLLNPRLESFIASVTFAYGLVQTYATGAGVEAGTAATTAFATATSAVFGALGAALQVFGQLTAGTASPAQTFANQMGTLIERINGTLVAFGTYVEDATGTAWLPAAQVFADAVNDVLDILKRSLDLFTALDEHGLPSMAQLQDLIDYTIELFATFTNRLGGVGGTVTATATGVNSAATAAFGAGSAIATNMSALGGAAGSNFGWGLLGWSVNAGSYGAGAQIAATTGTADTGLLGLLGAALWVPLRDAMASWGTQAGNYLVVGLALALDPATAAAYGIAWLKASITALCAFIEAQVRAELGIASPSKVMARLGMNIPLGLAAGITAGIPSVMDATGFMVAALATNLPAAGFDVRNERKIIVEFRGQAGGGVPMAPQQFAALKAELAYAIRLGA